MPTAAKKESANGSDTYALVQHFITTSSSRDAAIERVSTAVQNLSQEFGRKLDDSERDTRKLFDTFQASVGNQFQDVVSKFENALATRDAKLESVSAEFLKSRQAPWSQLIALGMLLLGLGGSIGWMAYQPIIARTTKVESTLDKIADLQLAIKDYVSENFVNQKDLAARTDRAKEDRDRVNRLFENLQANVFPKEVHEQRWARFEADIHSLDLRTQTQIDAIRRELDALQHQLGDTFTARDALLENKDRIAKLEQLVRDLSSREGSRP